MRRWEGRACRVRSHSVLTTEHAEAASRHTEATELTLHPQTRSVCSVTAFDRSVCSVVKTPYPASGRLTRSARRHGDTESDFEVGLHTAPSTIRPLREGRAPSRPFTPPVFTIEYAEAASRHTEGTEFLGLTCYTVFRVFSDGLRPFCVFSGKSSPPFYH